MVNQFALLYVGWIYAGNCCLLGYCCCCCCWKGLVNPSTLLFQPFFLFLFLYTCLRTLSTFFPREGSITTLYSRSFNFLLVCPSRSRLYLRAGVTCHSFLFDFIHFGRNSRNKLLFSNAASRLLLDIDLLLFSFSSVLMQVNEASVKHSFQLHTCCLGLLQLSCARDRDRGRGRDRSRREKEKEKRVRG
ncbi:hypothetical protein DFP73DRAFT_202543 [Morchella snyderi]|nr:hypothetical protein DFP73DRAFT_202543 [Morchella snyderi]